MQVSQCSIACFIMAISLCAAVPVPKKLPPKREKKPSPAAELLPDVSYRQYLTEVVNVLEGDKEFSRRISNISKLFDPKHHTDDLAGQLEFVNHSIRTRLDEIKRKEVERLNALEKMLEAKEAAHGDSMREAQVPVHPEVFNMDQRTIKKAHLDHDNPHSFEISDLKKLINQVTEDLHSIDKAKDQQYKEFEMTKEHLRRKKLKKIKDPKKKAEAEKEFQEAKQKHKQHEKVHQPGHREQLEDTWVKSDHMDKDSFDPHTFFNLHDLNGDGHLDISEIEALFIKELEKVYNKTNDTTVNRLEMEHEMQKMRQEMLDKVDANKDMMISWDEFKRWTDNPEFKRDEDWKTTEEADKPGYNDDEFKDFEDDYDREHPDEDDDDEDDLYGLHNYDEMIKAESAAEAEHHEQPKQQQQHKEAEAPHVKQPETKKAKQDKPKA